MGHLINPIAFRLGLYLSWETNWYVKFLYYTEFLHIILKLKFYMRYFFISNHILRSCIYSHYNLKFSGKFMLIRIWFYCSSFERILADFNNVFLESKNLWKADLYRRGRSYSNWSYYRKQFFVYNIFLFIFLLKKKYKTRKIKNKQMWEIKRWRERLNYKIFWLMGKIYNVRLKFNWGNFKNMLKVINNKSEKKILNKKVIFFFYLINKITKNMRNSKKLSKVLEKYLYHIEVLPLLKDLGIFFGQVIKLLTLSKFNIICKTNLLRNRDVSAQYIADYIGKKIRLGYPMKHLLKDLRKEFERLRSIGVWVDRSIIGMNNVRYKSNFKSLYFFLKFLFNKRWNGLYKMNNTFYTFEYICIIIYMKKKKWINFIFKFFKYKYGMTILFYTNKNLFREFFFSSLIKGYESYISPVHLKFNYILNSIYMNYFNYIWDIDSLTYMKNSHIYLGLYFLNKSIENSYYIYILKNRLKIKRKNQIKRISSILRGYKMSLFGRFSRKQRAARVTVYSGKVPLNTISLHIDYGFATIPLINSAIGIKVWFNLGKKNETKS